MYLDIQLKKFETTFKNQLRRYGYSTLADSLKSGFELDFYLDLTAADDLFIASDLDGRNRALELLKDRLDRIVSRLKEHKTYPDLVPQWESISTETIRIYTNPLESEY